MNRTKTSTIILLALAAGLVSFAAPYFALLYAVVPAVMACVLASWGILPYLLCAGLSVAASLLIGDAWMLALTIPTSFAFGFMMRKKCPWRYTVTVTAALMLLGFYTLFCIPGIIEGTGPYAQLQDSVRTVGEIVKNQLTELGQTENIELVETAVATYVNSIPDVLLPALFAVSILWSGLSLLISRIFLRKNPDLRPLAPFRDWQISKSFTIGCAVLLACSLILVLAGLDYGVAVSSSIWVIFVIPFAVQGVASFDFVWYMRRHNMIGRIIAIVLMVILFPSGLLLFAGIGILEQLMKVRKRLRAANGGNRPTSV